MRPGLGTVKFGEFSGWLPVALGMLGSLLIFLGTSRYGVGLSPDSATYIAAARSLLAGKGYLNYDGNVIFEYPPLYPTLLAAGALIWPDPITVARYINVLSFGLIVFVSSRWLIRRGESRFPFLIGSLLVLLSVPLIRVSVFAWTECVFALFTLLFLIQMDRYRDSAKESHIVVSGAFAALAFMTRYTGVAVILTGAALLLMRRRALLHHKIRHLFIFLLVSTLPAAPWFLRNLLRSRTLTGVRYPAPDTIGALTYTVVDTITTWWLPATLSFATRAGLSAMVAGVLIGSLFALGRDRRQLVIAKVTPCMPMLLFVGVYVTFLLFILSHIAAETPGNRFLSPVYAPLILVLTFLFATAAKVNEIRWIHKVVQSLSVIGLTLWLLYSTNQVTSLVRTYLDHGAGGFHQTRWVTSDLLHYLAVNELDGTIYNNEPHVFYLGTGRVAIKSPRKYGYTSRLPTRDLVGFEKSLKERRPVYLVWFDGAGGEHSYNVEEIAARFDMEPVVQRSDGAIYAVRGKKR